jgi:hypothetical protein
LKRVLSNPRRVVAKLSEPPNMALVPRFLDCMTTRAISRMLRMIWTMKKTVDT